MRKKENDGEKQRMSRGKKALLIIGIIVAVLAVLVIAYAIWERPPEIAPAPAVTNTPTPTSTPATQPGDVQPADAPVETDAPEEVYAEPLATQRDSGKYTVLMVGRDFASNSTDTIMVIQLDTSPGAARPRRSTRSTPAS